MNAIPPYMQHKEEVRLQATLSIFPGITVINSDPEIHDREVIESNDNKKHRKELCAILLKITFIR